MQMFKDKKHTLAIICKCSYTRVQHRKAIYANDVAPGWRTDNFSYAEQAQMAMYKSLYKQFQLCAGKTIALNTL